LAGAGFTSGASDILLREKKGNMDPMDNEDRASCFGKLAAAATGNARVRTRVLFSPGSSKRPRRGLGHTSGNDLAQTGQAG
jgi:hypothetical protein